MPLVLPKRCPNCGRKCIKTPAGYWLCDPAASGCGWTDDPATIQPTPEPKPAQSETVLLEVAVS